MKTSNLKRLGLKVALHLVLISAFYHSAFPCSLASGYFHQVTCLKGRVVGKSLGPLQYIRFLRQSFSVPDAELTLYEYKARAYRDDLKVIAKTKADTHGQFDFGRLTEGHYTLAVHSAKYSDWFDVEVTSSVRQTENVLIDVSPHFPDCKGGHEFIATSKS